MKQPKKQDLYSEVATILWEAHSHVARAVNTVMVHAYWNIGRLIAEHEQHGEKRAEYGKQLIAQLAADLTREFGKGFTESNLRYMRLLFLRFPIRYALRDNVSWTHYRLLTKVEKEHAREYYEQECAEGNWSTRELREDTEEPAIGLILCAEKNETVVRYTLPEEQSNIFTSKFKLYAPSEAELIRELQREQEKQRLLRQTREAKDTQ